MLDFRVMRKEVQRAVKPLEGVVGDGDIFCDKSALLVEVTSWGAVRNILPLVEDLVALSPKWALMRTQVRAEQWGDILTNIMKGNPYESILRIIWRQSLHGGRPWALPSATTQQIQTVRVQAKQKLSSQNANGSSLRESAIFVKGNLGPNPGAVLRELINSITTKTHLTLREVPEGEELLDGDWTICQDPGSGIPSGKIRVQLANSAQVRCLQLGADKQVISVGGEALPVEVFNFQVMSLPKLQGNGEGIP